MIAYEGPSLIDDTPIALIITDGSSNKKTGTMLQSWIIPQQGNINDKDGDYSVCGDCAMHDACYVTKIFAPRNVQKTYQAGKYDKLTSDFIRHEILRIGAWGDPAALPADVWLDLLRRTRQPGRHTGYTHQWRTCDPIFATFCMASVETEADMHLAHSMGYKTFRVKLPTEPKLPNETMCLNSTIGLTCKKCLLCNASSGDITIDVHGSGKSYKHYNILREKDV
jgi:hypothetical protein